MLRPSCYTGKCWKPTPLSLGADHPNTLQSKHNLAGVYAHQRKYDLAETLYKEALDGRMARQGADHPTTLNAKSNLAALYKDQGKLDRAETLYREVADAWKRRDKVNSLPYAGTLALLGDVLLRQRKFAAAEPVVRDCLAIRERKQPEEWRTFSAKSLLGGSLLGQQKYAEAEPLLLQGYEGLKQREARISAAGKVRLTEALERLVQLYEATGQKDKADPWRKKLEETKAAAKP